MTGDDRRTWFDDGIVRTEENRGLTCRRVSLIEISYEGGACSMMGGGGRGRRGGDGG